MNKQEKLTKIESVIRECCGELSIPPDVSYIWGNTITTPTLARKNADGLWETVGAEIHLEHILRAIGNIHSMRKINNTLEMAPFVYYDIIHPLHLQSDEFISWLYEVLCKP